MKIGAENRNKVIAAAVLGALALLSIWHAFSSSPQPAAAPPPRQAQGVPPLSSPPPPAAGRKTGKAQPVLTGSIDPRLRLDLLDASQSVRYQSKGRNIFAANVEPAIPKVKVQPFRPQVPKGPPPPPPINLKFFGFASHPGEQPRIFLSEGEDVFVARQGDIVNRRYKVIRINSTSVEIEDVLNNNRQSIPLTQG